MQMRRMATIGFIGALALLVGPVWAQDSPQPWQVGQDRVSPGDLQVLPPPPAPDQLTVQQAVEVALAHNAGFRRSVQRLLGARSSWAVAQQRWALSLFGGVERAGDGDDATTSRVGAALSYAAVTGADFSVTTELQRLDSDESAQTLSASVRQPLLAGSGRASSAYEQLRQARNGYRIALVSFFVERQALIERVIGAYFDAVRQQKLLGIQQSSVSRAELAVRDAQLRLEAGLIAEIDLTRAQLRLSRAQADVVFAEQGLRDSADRFLRVLGLEVGGEPRLVSMVTYQPTALDLPAALAEAMELRPDIRISELSLEDREAAFRIARSERLPSLDLVGSWRQIDNGASEQDWTVGLGVSVPIGSRSLVEAARTAEWSLLVSQQDHEDLKQEVVAEVRSEVRAAEAAQANVEIATKSLEVAERSLHIAGRMVEEGIATNRDLLDAQDDLTRSEISLVTSQINHYLATVRLDRALGRDLALGLTAIGVEAPPAEPEPEAAPAPVEEP